MANTKTTNIPAHPITEKMARDKIEYALEDGPSLSKDHQQDALTDAHIAATHWLVMYEDIAMPCDVAEMRQQVEMIERELDDAKYS